MDIFVDLLLIRYCIRKGTSKRLWIGLSLEENMVGLMVVFPRITMSVSGRRVKVGLV